MFAIRVQALATAGAILTSNNETAIKTIATKEIKFVKDLIPDPPFLLAINPSIYEMIPY